MYLRIGVVLALVFLVVRTSFCINCGISHTATGNRIINGRPALRAEFPWMVSIQRRNTPLLRQLGIAEHRDGFTHFCGGVLVAYQWVLTAAHCVDESLPIKEIRVVAGAHTLFKRTKEETVHMVEKVIKHPKWNPSMVVNDVALIQLKNPVKPSFPWINTICLPHKELEVKGFGTIAGWGLTAINGPNAETLMSLDLPLIPKERCQKIYGAEAVKNGTICAGYLTGGKDSCNTDSGGPLMKRYKEKFYVVGIISFGAGSGCAKAASITVSTKVYDYVNWIEETIREANRHTNFREFYKKLVGEQPV